jgi:predicted O-linked N-acetylglucosamine transferase (SPINDLY family)
MDPLTYSLAFSRLAPVQCVTWGHPETSGIATIDYFISADAMETPASDSQYTERLVRLAQPAVYYYRPPAPTGRRTRADFGLPEDPTIYGCLQMLWKFHPEFDALLAGVLRGDPRGIVIITEGLSAMWQERLTARFRRSMADVADRIRFVPRQSFDDFLGLTSVCDVMLDPTPFGGGNTTYEALAFGVPVVTLPSQFLRGRITNALYEMMDYRELVASTPQQYIDIAVRVGTDLGERERVRAEISSRSSALFENAAGMRELESFLERAVSESRDVASTGG